MHGLWAILCQTNMGGACHATYQNLVLSVAIFKGPSADGDGIREFRIRIYLPFWPDKGMTDLHWWELQQSGISALFSLSLTRGHNNRLHDTQVCFRVPPICTECLLSVPGPRPAHEFACWQCWNNYTSLALRSENFMTFVRPWREAIH
jgi:hypothetical protein